VTSTPLQHPAQCATIHGHVTYRAGDGAEVAIPEGRVELNPSADSVTLSWTTPDGSAGQAALTNGQYHQYVQDGKIVPAEGAAPRDER